MCRIAGIVNHTLPVEEIFSLVKQMCTELEHGGPDDEGIHSITTEHFVLGHRRLSIIDISKGGHQPMFYEGSKYIISYNGELYNYIELRNELEKAGYTFQTASDTEVVLAAYAAWGTDAFKKFYGMFAFALWDGNQKNILLVRDPSGIKPLYYAQTNEGLSFASEVRALKLIPYLQEKNTEWPVYLMAYGHLPEPITTLKKVKPVEKGTYIKYCTVKGTIKTESFKQYHYIEKISNRAEVLELVREKANESIKRHLISNAPIGVFLSGGLDSAIIAKLASNHVAKLNTLSLYFSENQYSEKKYQDILKEGLNCAHYQHLLTEDEFHAYLPDIMDSMDMPCCDGINTWFISKYAKEANLKTVLSGIGGDELFGGYPSFKRIKKVLALQYLPDVFLKTGRFSGSKQLRRLAYLSIPGATGRYLFLRGQFIPSEIAAHLNADEGEIWKILECPLLLNKIEYMSPQNQVSWMETNMYMQNQLLRDADIMSMAHGLEIRVPFLDNEFVEFTLKIESSVKYDGQSNKQLLIDAFKDILPEEVWNRPKMGFSFPFREWFMHSRYSGENDKNNLNPYHKKLVSGKLHWSQFFTLLLINQQYNAAA